MLRYRLTPNNECEVVDCKNATSASLTCSLGDKDDHNYYIRVCDKHKHLQMVCNSLRCIKKAIQRIKIIPELDEPVYMFYIHSTINL